MATCKREGCTLDTTGKSSYCATHKREAHAAWLEKVHEDNERRQQVHAQHDAAWTEALEAANTAAAEVEGHGVMGEATVTVRPGNGSFAQWLIRHTAAQSGPTGGVVYTVTDETGDAEKAFAAARAISRRLEQYGLKVEVAGRLAMPA